jgi:hypothetical protein
VEELVLRNSSHRKLCAGFDKECGALFEVTRPRVTLNGQKTNFRQGGGLRNSSPTSYARDLTRTCSKLRDICYT